MAMKSKHQRGAACLGLTAAVCLLASVTISVLFIYSHVSNSGAGSALCMPWLSIRCEPDDCGSMYVRCGRNQKRQEVPENKVCHKGALIPVKSRMHGSRLLPNNCRERTFYARNSTNDFPLSACNCPLVCSGNAVCRCYCLSGGRSDTICNNRVYRNAQQARCCCALGRGAELEVSSSWYWSLWTEAVGYGRVAVWSSFKQICDSLRDYFTFPPTLEADACCTPTNQDCFQC